MKLMSKIAFLFGEGFKSIFKHGFMSFASVTIIMACLIIMGSFGLLSVNIDAVIKQAESETEVLAYVDKNFPSDEIPALEKKVQRLKHVLDVRFVTRDEAYDEFVEIQRENYSFFEDIGPDVFRHRFVIHMDDVEFMEELQGGLYALDGIVNVRAPLEISRGFLLVRNIVNAVSLALAVLLISVSIFIMANTIKLTTFGRREEIAVMKMVGATNNFIRWPFMVEGMVLGMLGAGFAFLVEWGIYILITDTLMTSIISGFIPLLPFGYFMLPLAVVFSAIGLLIGTFGGIVAIRNYLKV